VSRAGGDLIAVPASWEAAAVRRLTSDVPAVRLPGRFATHSDAWATAVRLVTRAHELTVAGTEAALRSLDVVGEYSLPPPGFTQREFQPLHLDFGVPRLSASTVDVALYTALYVEAAAPGSGAATRLVSIGPLLQQRDWPGPAVIRQRLRASPLDDSPVEGILARLVESVDGSPDLVPKDADGFLCGMELATIDDEQAYFGRHGMSLAAVEERVTLGSGEMLLFDNLAIAHGRLGQRHPNELRQLCIGYRRAELAAQSGIADRVVSAFGRHG
jgi:hypothetical protein